MPLLVRAFHQGPLMAPQHTRPVEAAINLRWDQVIFGRPINQIPRGARVSLSLYAVVAVSPPTILDDDLLTQAELLGWINFPIYASSGVLATGDNLLGLQLWPSSEPYDVTCMHNTLSELYAYVKFEGSSFFCCVNDDCVTLCKLTTTFSVGRYKKGHHFPEAQRQIQAGVACARGVCGGGEAHPKDCGARSAGDADGRGEETVVGKPIVLDECAARTAARVAER